MAIGEAAIPGTSGDFDDIYSTATGTNTVNSPYTYEGYWTKEWEDLDGDGINDHLYAVWNPTAGIEEILPELDGADIGNSMWSSASNMKSVSNAALGQVGITRFLMGPKNNFWIKGMGDFTYHATRDGIDGYDYNGGGYAVGADRRFTPNTILAPPSATCTAPTRAAAGPAKWTRPPTLPCFTEHGESSLPPRTC